MLVAVQPAQVSVAPVAVLGATVPTSCLEPERATTTKLPVVPAGAAFHVVVTLPATALQVSPVKGPQVLTFGIVAKFTTLEAITKLKVDAQAYNALNS